eukprot:4576639-Prymnesium_polylepis.1
MRQSDCANVEISGIIVTRRVRAPRSVRHLLMPVLLGIVVSVRSSMYCCRSATAPGERASERAGADSKGADCSRPSLGLEKTKAAWLTLLLLEWVSSSSGGAQRRLPTSFSGQPLWVIVNQSL